ncbi:hypothetical protein [Luteolibacter sp. LG18]|uniref:hypothetical protein n=1 Tax=Luteolibacter sp. LG18 TaxID=2819286 RepID=UPI0030C71A0D
MEKHLTILQFIEQISPLVDSLACSFIDHWDADLCAIGLTDGCHLIYVNTCRHLEIHPVRYDYDIEVITEPETGIGKVIREGEGVSLEDLKMEIRNRFGPGPATGCQTAP